MVRRRHGEACRAATHFPEREQRLAKQGVSNAGALHGGRDANLSDVTGFGSHQARQREAAEAAIRLECHIGCGRPRVPGNDRTIVPGTWGGVRVPPSTRPGEVQDASVVPRKPIGDLFQISRKRARRASQPLRPLAVIGLPPRVSGSRMTTRSQHGEYTLPRMWIFREISTRNLARGMGERPPMPTPASELFLCGPVAGPDQVRRVAGVGIECVGAGVVPENIEFGVAANAIIKQHHAFGAGH